MTVGIRRQQSGDGHGVRDVLTAAFADDGRVAALAEGLRARSDSQAQLVATKGGELIGFVGLSISWVDAPAHLLEVLVLSPLAVTPAHQSQGFGRRLLDVAVAEAARLGSPLVFLEGDPGYYGRLGWRAGSELGFTAPSPRIPSPAFQVVALPGHDPSSMHGPLVYNDTFWAHDCVGLRPPPD